MPAVKTRAHDCGAYNSPNAFAESCWASSPPPEHPTVALLEIAAYLRARWSDRAREQGSAPDPAVATAPPTFITSQDIAITPALQVRLEVERSHVDTQIADAAEAAGGIPSSVPH